MTVSVGLIGCGAWGKLILRDLIGLGARVHVVVSTDAELGGLRAAGATSANTDVASLTEPVNGFIVATPISTHATVIERLLPLGKAIFVEKPLSDDVNAASRLLALAGANQQGRDGKTLDEARAEVTTPGTLAHRAVEDHINGRPETALRGDGDIIEKARNAFAAYLHWEAINRITFRHTEVPLASEKHAFGGTLDAVGMIGNALVLCDWKCANAVYADYLYQLAAYGLLWQDNYPDHPLAGGFHLCRFAKEQGDFSHHYFPSLDDEAETFLRMRDLFDRVKRAERRVR